MKLFSLCIETIISFKRPVSACNRQPPLRTDSAFAGSPVLLPYGLCLALHFQRLPTRCRRPSGTRDRTPDPWPQTLPSLGEPQSSQICWLKKLIFFLAIIWKTNKKNFFWGAFFARKRSSPKIVQKNKLYRKLRR
jgi:hypothetical protein